jgi:aspartyl protease
MFLSWKPAGNQTVNDNSTSFLAGNDTLHLYTHFYMTDIPFDTAIPDVPVRLMTTGDNRPGILGMGSSSTLLQRLYDIGEIASKTYSLYVGSAFNRAGGIFNGSNVFGGYDASRFQGPVYTYPMDLSQPDFLPVTVTDIIVDHPTNPLHERISLMADQPFQARLSTERYSMVLPYSVTSRFVNTVHAQPAQKDEDEGRGMHLTAPFNGTMTIVLAGGFNVTLPPEAISNPATSLSSVVAQSPNYTGPYYLSASYLSQVYLMMDFDTQHFHLAQAVPTIRAPSPQSFCAGDVPVPHPERQRSVWEQRHIGAIIGGVVGGAALLMILMTVCFVRKRRSLAAERQRRWDRANEDRKKAAIKGSVSSSADLEMQRGPSRTSNRTASVPTQQQQTIVQMIPEEVSLKSERGRDSPLEPIVRERSVSPLSTISRYSTVSRER